MRCAFETVNESGSCAFKKGHDWIRFESYFRFLLKKYQEVIFDVVNWSPKEFCVTQEVFIYVYQLNFSEVLRNVDATSV